MRAPSAHDVGSGVRDDTCSIHAATRHRDTRCIDGDARNRSDITLEGAQIGWVNGDSSRHLIDPTKHAGAGRGHLSTPTRWSGRAGRSTL
jgi:hypothetical protein